MKTKANWDRIGVLCRQFLVFHKHKHKDHETYRILNQLHEETRPWAKPRETLKIHVADSVKLEDKVG